MEVGFILCFICPSLFHRLRPLEDWYPTYGWYEDETLSNVSDFIVVQDNVLIVWLRETPHLPIKKKKKITLARKFLKPLLITHNGLFLEDFHGP